MEKPEEPCDLVKQLEDRLKSLTDEEIEKLSAVVRDYTRGIIARGYSTRRDDHKGVERELF